MTKVAYRTSNVDGLKIFYREGDGAMHQHCCSFMVSRPAAICFGISFRCLPIASTSLRRICQASDNPICRRTTRFRTPLPSWPK